jgi:hypothetical protein
MSRQDSHARTNFEDSPAHPGAWIDGMEEGSTLAAAIASVAIAGALVLLYASTPRTTLPPARAAVVPAALDDPSRFILNALLVPALDGDAVPLRWVDPRRPALCGPETVVRVNGQLLAAGTLVPDAPFTLEWQADGCRPFGVDGPRYDGRVTMTVYREDWGLSASVEPDGLRVSAAGRETTLRQARGAALPFIGRAFEPVGVASFGTAD